MERPNSRPLKRLVLLLALLLLPWATPTVEAQWTLRGCTTVSKNLFVRDVMQDIYYWYQFLPNVNAAQYDSPEAYLEAVRYRPLDQTFSYIQDKATNDAFFSDSQYIGFGFSTQTTLNADGTDVQIRILQVFPDSPASEAGIARGDRVLAVGGISVTDWWTAGQLGLAFGPAEVDYTTPVLFQRADAAPVEVTLTKRVVTMPTVSMTKAYAVDGRRVGYIFFRNFVQPSDAALDEAFTTLKAAGVTELVLDLRYNGGGLVSVAQHLASLIGGVRTNDQVFAEFFHNDKNAFRNEIMRFEPADLALTLDRLVVITTKSSASASELVINALRPFIPVIVIGEATYGKPVGQYAINFCDKVLAPVSFTLRNANGEGDYFGGIPPTCAAADDIGHQLGDPAEGSLAEAFYYVRTGTCSAPPAAGTERTRRVRAPLKESGWQELVGAR